MRFLKLFHPDGPWALTAIIPDGSTVTRTFMPAEEDAARRWVESHQNQRNIYFTVNPVRQRIDSKATKEDILGLQWLHVDIDPRVGEEPAAEQERIAADIARFDPAPTVVINSGGGLQCFWRIDRLHPADAAEVVAQLEAYNIQLSIVLGGDHCHDICRIMRLPGTVNLPTARKAKKGRVPVVARVDAAASGWGRTYILERDFTAAVVKEGQLRRDLPRVSVSIDRSALVDVSDLNSVLPKEVHVTTRRIIIDGLDPEDPGRHPSRSEWVFAAACGMVRGGTAPGVMASVLLSEWPISAHVLDKGGRNPLLYAQRQIERAMEDVALRRAEEAEADAATAGEYPLPDPLLFHSGEWVCRKNSEDKDIPVASTFGVVARIRTIDDGDKYGLRVALRDRGGVRRAIDLPAGDFLGRGSQDSVKLLMEQGLRPFMGGDSVKAVLSYLSRVNPELELLRVDRPGWHGGAHVSPGGQVAGGSIELANPVAGPEGTAEAWREAAGAALAADGCRHFAVGLMAGFAGVLVDLLGMDTCGINLSGPTSVGKSIALKLAASVWSRDMFVPARTTSNAVESVARRAAGSVLALDELNNLDGREVGSVLWTIAGGRSKERMRSDGKPRDTFTWRTFALFSNEQSLKEKVSSVPGEQMKGGQSARFPDVDVSGVNARLPKGDIDRIEAAWTSNSGHAGPAFAAALAARGAAGIREAVEGEAQRLAAQIDEARGAEARAARPFALMLVAGGLAQEFGLLGSADLAAVVQWAWGRYLESDDARTLRPEEEALDNLSAWIARKMNVTIKPTTAGRSRTSESTSTAADGSTRTIRETTIAHENNRETDGWYDEDAVYIPKGLIWEAAGRALKERTLGQVLAQRGLLARVTPGRNTVKHVPGHGAENCYALSRRRFGRVAEPPPDAEPPPF